MGHMMFGKGGCCGGGDDADFKRDNEFQEKSNDKLSIK